MTTNTDKIIRECDGGEPGAAMEGTLLNPGYTIRERKVTEAAATTEPILTHAGESARECDGGQSAAASKCTVGNPGETVRESK